eukprot:scaffold12888_cov48-Prasinocladus_malaysianus.AAC.1
MSAEQANKQVQEELAGRLQMPDGMIQARNLNAEEEKAVSDRVNGLPAGGPCLRDKQGWHEILTKP